MSACSVRGEKCITIYSCGCSYWDSGCMLCSSLQAGWERLELLTRSSWRMWLSTYLDRGAHTLEDSWGQSVPHRSFRCPYSTWMLAGSQQPGCGRDITITLWKVNENWSVKTDIASSFFLIPFSSSILSGADLETYPGLFWMQRRARLKAMFRHSSSEEAMSLCRSFYKQWHKAVTDMLTCWQVLHLTSCVCCLWLTMKYWMISGLLLDFSSTSVNTSNTSIVDRGGQHCIAHFDTGLNVKLRWVSYPPLPLLSTSSLGTLSCLQRSAKPRQICWQGEGNQWTCRLTESRNNHGVKLEFEGKNTSWKKNISWISECNRICRWDVTSGRTWRECWKVGLSNKQSDWWVVALCCYKLGIDWWFVQTHVSTYHTLFDWRCLKGKNANTTQGHARTQRMLVCLPSLSSGATSAEERFTGNVSPASRDFSWTRSGFSADRALVGGEEKTKSLSLRASVGGLPSNGHIMRMFLLSCTYCKMSECFCK